MSLDQEIYNAAIEEGFSQTAAKIIVAQARLESGNYGSNVFKNNNNMFGMKYIGQPLATRGTIAPFKERSKPCQTGGTCVDRDYYAKYKSPTDSIRDLLGRLYKKERNGIGFNQLKDVQTPDEFAQKLKKRGYYGFFDYGTSAGKKEAEDYAAGLKARLLLVKISAFYSRNKNTINYTALGLIILGATAFAYMRYYKK